MEEDTEGLMLELGVVPLEEAGGFLSWLRRAMTNADPGVADELRRDLSGVRTEAERRALLAEVDTFLAEASNARSNGTLGDLGLFVGWAFMRKPLKLAGEGLVAAVARIVGHEFHPLAGRLGALLGGAGTGLGIGLAGAQALAVVLKTVARYDGSLDDYIGALAALRADVVALRLPR